MEGKLGEGDALKEIGCSKPKMTIIYRQERQKKLSLSLFISTLYAHIIINFMKELMKFLKFKPLSRLHVKLKVGFKPRKYIEIWILEPTFSLTC